MSVIDELREALEEIGRQYENQDLSHVDFRVWAKRTADAALSRSMTGVGDNSLVEFAKWAITNSAWLGADLDGADVQEEALRLGLIVRTKYDPEIHGHDEASEYVSPGDDWFVFSDKLKAARHLPPAGGVPDGWKIVPKKLTPKMRTAARDAMPVEIRYWQENGIMHAEMFPENKCVDPQSVFDAALAAAPSPEAEG